MLAHYPDWHQQPFRLSCSEIKNPRLVFDEFFERFDLENIRTELKEMMTDAMGENSHNSPANYIWLCDNLEKLVEACHVLHNNNELRPVAGTAADEHNIEEDDPVEACDTGEDGVRFTKPFSPMEIARANPAAGISKILKMTGLDVISQQLAGWYDIAVCNDSSCYEMGSERADLSVFVRELHKLYEALYAVKEIGLLKEYVGRDYLSPGLRHELYSDENFEHLEEEEISGPETVIAAFFDQFTYRYARLELWDLLDAVITYEGAHPGLVKKTNLLFIWECMAALLHIAFRLHKDSITTPQDQIPGNAETQ